MKLKQIVLENFRSYSQRTQIDIEELTVLIGRNDAGKSSVLEALEIFFNSEAIKIDKDDASKGTQNPIVRIGCVFEELPQEIVLDADAKTTLADEHMLNRDRRLEVHQLFDCSKSSIKPTTILVSEHPTAEGADDLLFLKNADLKRRLKDLRIDANGIDARKNPDMRRAIWTAVGDLKCASTELALDRADAKEIWSKLEPYLPVFALFRSDRPSTDEDAEVQDPMKLAVIEAIKSVEAELDQIKRRVQERATDVALRTLGKLQEMAPELANKLMPHFRSEPKWDSIFKLSLTGDDAVPINKRGSGVRRLILLNFFRAEVERRQTELKSPGVIYAIEEPETSQHPTNQRLLVQALRDLALQENCQVLLTTHVPELAGLLPLESLRYVYPADEVERIGYGSEAVFEKIADDLGVLPDKDADDRVRVLVCVEGPHDVCFMKEISSTLKAVRNDLPDLKVDARVAVLPLGGGTLRQWVDEHYLKGLGIPEVHIYDRDVESPPKYQAVCNQVNARNDGSWATLTSKRELENYLHPEAIRQCFSVDITVEAMTDVPEAVSNAVNQLEGHVLGKMGVTRAKRLLNSGAVKFMTPEHFAESDPDGELIMWLSEIAERLRK